jgi:hypothetical protein
MPSHLTRPIGNRRLFECETCKTMAHAWGMVWIKSERRYEYTCSPKCCGIAQAKRQNADMMGAHLARITAPQALP